MDRRVKERLIGATILVALIVLIVPELLSGPRRPSPPPLMTGQPAPTRNVSVDLATSKATPVPQVAESAAAGTAGVATPGVAAPGVAAPGTAASGGDAARGDQTSEPAPAAASPEAPAPASAAPSAPTITTLHAQDVPAPALETQLSAPKSSSGTHHAWAVQLGSFASKENAEKLVHQLKAGGGSSIYLISSGSGSSARYKVRMGPLADRGAAERAVLKLKASGYAATIVTPAS